LPITIIPKFDSFLFAKGGGGLNIIFDITFQTNNLGLVQRSNIISQKQSIVIIGDSFTQGEGAVPWFYDLEKKWQSNEYQLVNLGITGTGILQWYDTLQWFSKIAKIKHIYFLFISADWERPRWYAREDLGSKGLFLWDDSRGDFEFWKNKIPPDMIFIGKDSDQETILSNLHNIVSDSTILRAKNYLRNSYLVRMVYGLRNKIKNDKIFDQNKACFEKIITRYGAQNITFFHIPVGKEVSQGVYDATGRQVRDLILTRNIAYIDGLALCGLTGEDFLPLDGHPNESGYSKILKCLLRSLP